MNTRRKKGKRVEKKLLERIQMGRITDGLRLDLPEEMMKNRSRR